MKWSDVQSLGFRIRDKDCQPFSFTVSEKRTPLFCYERAANANLACVVFQMHIAAVFDFFCADL